MSAEAPSQTNTFPVVTTAILVVLTVVFGLELVLGATPPTGFLLAPSTRTLRSLGALSPTSIQAAGEWWRVLTTVFLHADLSHLFFNAIVLFGAGYMLEMLIGRAWLIALFLLGGISGSLLSLAVDSADRTEVGASGAIMALLAVLVVVSFHLQGWENRFRLQLASLRFLIPSLVPLGTTGGEQIAYAAHVGGALGGGVMGLGVLALWPREDERPRIGTFVGALTICGALGVLAAALPPLVKHHLSGVDALYEQSVVDSRDSRTDDAIASLTRAHSRSIRKTQFSTMPARSPIRKKKTTTAPFPTSTRPLASTQTTRGSSANVRSPTRANAISTARLPTIPKRSASR